MQVLNLNISIVRKVVLRYFLVWMADAVSIGITAFLLPGIYFVKDTELWFLNAFVVALGIALLNVLVRPLLIILILPINIATLGLTTLVLNSGLFYLIGSILGSFVIDSFSAAFIGTMVLTTVNTLLGSLVQLSDDYSIFSAMMHKVGSLTRPKLLDDRDRGLVIIQIDGLSHPAIQKGIKRGKMPFISDLLNRRRYRLNKWYCGLPSQTSSIQAGLFYGNRAQIPGFRWYSKREKRELVSSSSSDLNAIDTRLSDSDGPLLADGTCINTLLHGGARKKLLTLSVLLEKDFRRRKDELEDFAIYSLHPYLYNRAILFLVLDFLVDRFQAVIRAVKQRNPRVKRNFRFSLLRAIGTAFLRESSTYFLTEDVNRGIPVVYVNYIGYDIVAHHAGPHTGDALSTLAGIDRQIRKINRAITRQRARHYDLVVLSDHGQSRSVPFAMLYGRTLAGFIEEKLNTPLSARSEDANMAHTYFATLMNEMQLVEKAFAPPPLVRSRKTLERIERRARARPEPEAPHPPGKVVVCCSGNLAHVYFVEYPGRMTTEQLIHHQPNLLDVLVSHPGIGFVVTSNEEGEVFVMSQNGLRRLKSGRIEGEDPLQMYDGDGRLARELIQLSEYPDSGDVIINGRILDDGVVVCFEEQVGTHGGTGGFQTQPFVICHERFGRPAEDIGSPEEMHRFLKTILGREAAPAVLDGRKQ